MAIKTEYLIDQLHLLSEGMDSDHVLALYTVTAADVRHAAMEMDRLMRNQKSVYHGKEGL